MLKRISKETALFELMAGNEKLYIKGCHGSYMRAIDCTWRFTVRGEGYDLNTVTFYIELED